MRRALVISLCIHLFAFLSWIGFLKFGPRPITKKAKPMWVEIQPMVLPQAPVDTNRYRVVATTLQKKTLVPEADAFLGKQNQRVIKEMSASSTDVGREASINAVSSKLRSGKKSQAASEQKFPTHLLSHLGIPVNLPPSVRNKDEPAWTGTEVGVASVASNEYVQGIKESHRTALNTKSYVFFSYFQRIREGLDRAWVPIIRKRIMAYYKSGRTLTSDTDHVTRTVVVLNNQGEVIRVQLIEKSGTQDLDEAAVDAFNSAGPFPNPPIGMIDSNHEVQVPWDFILRS